MQLKLIDIPTCHICGKGLMPKKHKSIVYNGFIDKDNSQICHLANPCRFKHYIKKQGNDKKTTYSEVPFVMTP